MNGFYDSMVSYARIPLDDLSQKDAVQILTAFQRRLWAVGSIPKDAYPAHEGITYESNLREIPKIWAAFLHTAQRNALLEHEQCMVEGIERKLHALYGNLEQGNTKLAHRIAVNLSFSHVESLSLNLLGLPGPPFVDPPPAE
ncbi:MAG: hypothetical protein LBL59_07690 [Xanthomonadaceae bacterium]|jgi:hypothetical protein|nr:hypothetical protein [Xanthomonadaceae bacterium]